MEVFRKKKDLRKYLENECLKKHSIGFVATMGALHKGHRSLIRYCKKDNDVTVCSIFVNPIQFNNPEDLEKYPRPVEADLNILNDEHCDVVYLPDREDIYDHDPDRTVIQFGKIETVLEGKYRPGHFRGVGLVVAKLFHIVQPNRAYFGQKDLQQFYLVRQLINDLSYNIKLVCVPTVREKDGLAFSSRNVRIRRETRPLACKFYDCLVQSRQLLKEGLPVDQVRKFATDFISGFPPLTLEYFEVVDTRDFSITKHIINKYETALCIAGYLNNIRLIDNVFYN